MAEIERTARCACGSLTATTRGEPVNVYVCSCDACQRLSGTVFTYGALFPKDAVSLTGDSKAWRHTGDSGRWVETQFCPSCGSSVLFRLEGVPEVTGVAVGCFTDAEFAKPDWHFWASRGHTWLAMPDGVERYETQPEE